MTAQRIVNVAWPVVLLCAIAALVSAGAAPADPPAAVGDRIDVHRGTPTTFPAGRPFHIRHGWGIGATDVPEQAGLWRFRLELDGVTRPADFVTRSTDPAPTTTFDYPVLNRGWVFNFPAGMRGVHTFTGHWIGPCRLAAQGGTHTSRCGTPNAPVDVLTRSVTVDFQRQNLALGKPVTASGEYPGNLASLAVDGDWWSYWSSGNFPPAWIEVDLGAVQTIGEIDLGITQLPDCATAHRVSGRATTSEEYGVLSEFSAFTVDQQILRYVAATPTHVRYIRVETTSSCSWVGWREIAVYAPNS